jgi:uncharacterized protein YkwD
MRERSHALARAVALACVWMLIGCAPACDAAPAPASGKRAGAHPPDLARVEREVVAKVNRYRSKEGLKPLASDPRIAEIARGHSRAMAAGKSGFGHGGFRDRSKSVEGKIPYSRVAENVAHYGRRPSAEIPGIAVERWVASRGHRHNIEGPFALTGVGAAVAPDGSIYLTQIFVKPR